LFDFVIEFFILLRLVVGNDPMKRGLKQINFFDQKF